MYSKAVFFAYPPPPIFRRSPSIFGLFISKVPASPGADRLGRSPPSARQDDLQRSANASPDREAAVLFTSVNKGNRPCRAEINNANDVCSTGLMKAGLASPSTNQIQDQHSTCTASSVAVVTPETRCCNKNDYYCSVFCCCLSGQALAEL